MDLELQLTCALEGCLVRLFPGMKANRAKLYWCRRSKPKICDLIVNLTPAGQGTSGLNAITLDSDCLQRMIDEVVKKSKDWCVPLEECQVVSVPSLQINVWLNRTAMTTTVLQAIGKESKETAEKRTLPHLPKRLALICTPAVDLNAESFSLTDLRSLIMMELVKRILDLISFSFETWTSHHLHVNGTCQSACGTDCETVLADTCSVATSVRMPQSVLQSGSQIDRKSNDINPDGYVNRLKDIIHCHGQKPASVCFLVTPQHAEVHATELKEFCKTVAKCENSPSFVRLVHGPVVGRGDHQICRTAKQLYRMQTELVKNSFTHKYGAHEVDEGDHHTGDLGPMFEHLADLNIKFFMLGCSASKGVRLKIDEGNSGGTFIMYNYARICVLLSNFEASMHEKLFAKLPPMEEVDFSLLKKEEEWNLVLLLAKYPKLIHGIVSELLNCNSDSVINPAFHKIPEFMSELSHRISVYYSHVRVLLPAVHLQGVMFARIWLLKCVKRILEDIFDLLNVTPVKQM